MVAGASGAVGSTVLGIPYWNTNGNSGTKGGLSCRPIPRRLSTPVINLSGAQITPSVAQRAFVLLTRALGDDAEELEKGVWYGKPEQVATIASQWYSTLITQNREGKGEDVFDRARAGVAKDIWRASVRVLEHRQAGSRRFAVPGKLVAWRTLPGRSVRLRRRQHRDAGS